MTSQNPKNLADVICEWPLIPRSKLRRRGRFEVTCLTHSPGCRGASDAVRGWDALWDPGHVEEAALPAPELGHTPVGPRIGHLPVQAPEMQPTPTVDTLTLRRLAMESLLNASSFCMALA